MWGCKYWEFIGVLGNGGAPHSFGICSHLSGVVSRLSHLERGKFGSSGEGEGPGMGMNLDTIPRWIPGREGSSGPAESRLDEGLYIHREFPPGILGALTPLASPFPPGIPSASRDRSHPKTLG